MRPTLKLASLYFTLFPAQRWLTIAAVALFALGALAALGSGPGTALALVFALLLGGILLVVPLVGTVGAVFRLLSSSSTHRFLPSFRRRLLTATGLVVCTATVMTVWVVSSSHDSPPVIPVTVYAAAAWSALLWLPFFAPRSIFAFVPLVIAAWCVERIFGPSVGFVDDLAPLVGAALIVAWVAFVAWYLRARAVPRFPEAGLLGRVASRSPVRPLAGSTACAADTYLWGTRTTPSSRMIALLFSTLGYGALAIVDPGVPDGLRFTFGLPVVAAAVWLPAMRSAASRARLLWLRENGDRVHLFRTIERTMLRLDLTVATVVAVGVAGVAAVFAGVPLRGIAGILSCSAATAAAGAYIGLMCVQGDRVGAWLVQVAYGLSTLVAFIAAVMQPVHAELLLGVASAQAACAVFCRSMALHRWRDVDWLSLRIGSIRRAA